VDLIAVTRFAGWEKFILSLIRNLEICGNTFDNLFRK
jgi:hypothetical protein